MRRAVLKAAQLDHPVLGRHIVSLGYKDVFLACIENLASVPVWEKRKTLRPVHAIEIAEAKLLKKNVVSLWSNGTRQELPLFRPVARRFHLNSRLCFCNVPPITLCCPGCGDLKTGSVVSSSSKKNAQQMVQV